MSKHFGDDYALDVGPGLAAKCSAGDDEESRVTVNDLGHVWLDNRLVARCPDRETAEVIAICVRRANVTQMDAAENALLERFFA